MRDPDKWLSSRPCVGIQNSAYRRGAKTKTVLIRPVFVFFVFSCLLFLFGIFYIILLYIILMIINMNDEFNVEAEEKIKVSFRESPSETQPSFEEKIASASEKPSLRFDWEKAAHYLILGLIAFLPLWILPFAGATLGFSKSLLLGFVIIGASVFYLIYLLEKGSIKIPWSILFLALVFILAASFISSLFSPNFSLSVFGSGNETDTSISLLLAVIGLFLTALLFQSERKVLSFFLVLFCSSIVLFVYHLFHTILGLNFSPWGLLPRKIDTLVGNWNELAIFFGFIALEAAILFEFLTIKRRWKYFLAGLIAVSFVMMAVINFTAAWLVFGVFMLVFLVYLYSSYREARNFARLPLFLLLVVIFFVLARVLVADAITALGIESLDVRLSWSATWQITKDTLKESVKNMILGSGPNTFLYDWLKHKPIDINRTLLWDARFTGGIGFVPSFFATSGIFGFLAWLFFLGAVLYYGFRSIYYSGSNLTKCLLLGTFFGSVYLWVFNVIYTTNNFLFALSFMVTGLFLAVLIIVQKVRVREFSFINNTSVGFISALVVVLLIIAGVASFYMMFQKYWSAYMYSNGVIAFNREGNLDKAEEYFLKALRFNAQDRYYNSLAELGLIRLSQIVNQQIPVEEKRIRFQNALAATIQNAQSATKMNSLDPANWMLLGRIYESIIPFQVEGARQYALDSYKEALTRNPRNPVPLLSSARVEIQSSDFKSARSFLNSSIELKGDLTVAHFLLEQIEAQEGNLDAAIKRTEQAFLFSPNDLGVLFQLGLLYYQKKDYTGAAFAFEKTVSLSPNYSNALYFLGLTYDIQGKKGEAIKQFSRVQELNPDNTEVTKILSNLKAGRGALSEISPPLPAPEKREEPPVEENR